MKYASLALLGGFDMVVGSAEAEDVVDAEVRCWQFWFSRPRRDSTWTI